MHVLRPEQQAEWLAILARCRRHDFYHLPGYHALAEDCGEGEARLFVHAEGDHVVALPLLVRPLAQAAGLPAPPRWSDVSGVYGYTGPVASHDDVPDAVVRRFQAGLTRALRDDEAVAVFARLHPLIPQHRLLAGLGQCRYIKQTVSIDLTLPPELARARYRENHRQTIRKLERLGVTCRRDEAFGQLGLFAELYYETMKRVGATPWFFFPRAYFEGLVSRCPGHVHLFLVEGEGRVMAAGLFLECRGVVQAHLSATRGDCLKMAPTKLLLDSVGRWARERGNRVLHLGGGVTADPADSLLRFKRGFSDRLERFCTWRWVLDPEAYAQAVGWKRALDGEPERTPAVDYFPEYRAPTAAAFEQVA